MLKRVVVVSLVLFGACGDDSSGDDTPDSEPQVHLTDSEGTNIDAVTFGQAFVGQDATSTIRVTNAGTAATGPIALAISGTAANDFVIDNVNTTCAGLALAPDASCDVVLFFRPTAVGERAATLSITSDPGGTHTVALSGLASMPDLHFNPTTISFDRLEVGKTSQTTIELRNDGTDPAPLDSIDVSGAAFTRGFSTCGATLAPGTSCDISVTAAPQTLGGISGNLTVESAGIGYTAGLAVAGARKVTVASAGTGTGTITSSPAGIDCPGTCSALFEGPVTLTVAPGANTQVTSWSVAGCGTGASCVVPADVTPLTVNLSLTLTGASTVDLMFAGTGIGEVKVIKSGTGLLATCFGSCSVPAEPGDTLKIGVSTPSTFAGYTGGCIGEENSVECTMQVPVGATTLTVTFNKDAKEQWTRLLPGDMPHGAAFDSSGNLLVASPTKLYKLSPTGTTLWSLDITANGVETGPGDTIYVVTGTELKKLDASGQQLWARATGTVCPSGHGVAVDADGAVAVRSGNTASRWNAAGTLTWTRTFTRSAGKCSVGIDAAKNVLVDVENQNTESTDARVFLAADGTEIEVIDRASAQYHSVLSSSPTGEITTCSSGHSDTYLKSPGVNTSLVISSPDWAPNWCGRAGSDVAWLYFTTSDFNPPQPPPAWNIARWNTSGLAWSMMRSRTHFNVDRYGTYANGTAGATSGRIAVVGYYTGLTTSSAWVQVYDP